VLPIDGDEVPGEVLNALPPGEVDPPEELDPPELAPLELAPPLEPPELPPLEPPPEDCAKAASGTLIRAAASRHRARRRRCFTGLSLSS
jgi:hypothetical protein